MTKLVDNGPASTVAGPARDPWIKSVRSSGTWLGSMSTAVRIRDFAFTIDEPVTVGGTNSAPTPMEFVAAAVGGCATVVIEQVASELGIRFDAIETETTAHQDVRGFRGTANVSPHFLDFTLHLRVVTAASEGLRAALREQVEARSPAIALIRDAGVTLEILWTFRSP